MQEIIQVKLPLGAHATSVNDLYKPGLHKKKRWSVSKKKYIMELVPIILKSKEARDYSNLIQSNLKKYTSPEVRTQINKIKRFEIDYCFLLNSGIKRRDVSNLIKVTEDAIFSWLGKSDDSQVFKFSATKVLKRNISQEYLLLEVKEYKGDTEL